MFHELTIRDVRPETAGAVAITFDVPDAAAADFAWQPGQYLTLRDTVDGQDVRRSYSIASLPGKPLTVGVKRLEGGVFSPHCQGLKPGDSLQVMPPEGRFTPRGEDRLVLIASGSGITPIVSIAADALARGAEVTLIYGNRSHDTIMFRDTLDGLKDRYLDRFTLIHILSRETQDVALLNGRITGDKIGPGPCRCGRSGRRRGHLFVRPWRHDRRCCRHAGGAGHRARAVAYRALLSGR